MTDKELAAAIHGQVQGLNDLVQLAANQELVVAYRIKAPQEMNGTNPRIIVSVMTEVL